MNKWNCILLQMKSRLRRLRVMSNGQLLQIVVNRRAPGLEKESPPMNLELLYVKNPSWFLLTIFLL